MKPLAALAMLAALSACGSLDPDAEFPNPGCRAAIYDDANVQAKLKETTNPNAGGPTFRAANEAKRAAYDKCLNINPTQPRRGGVQRVTGS